MNRLQSELNRLYVMQPQTLGDPAATSALIGTADTVRAMVLEVTRPSGWEQLSTVWRGVQTELALPAPAIAVSGTDGLQLWFSIAEPIAVARAHAFVEGLRQRFLAEVDPRRVRLMPTAAAPALHAQRHARLVPALQESTGNWSAFVAPDLAPVFDETPWLDIAPGEEGQANLLRGIEVMQVAAFEEAMAGLLVSERPLPQQAATHATGVEVPSAPAPPAVVAADQEAERFLQQVMRDDTVSLRLRIEAARALLAPRRQV